MSNLRVTEKIFYRSFSTGFLTETQSEEHPRLSVFVWMRHSDWKPVKITKRGRKVNPPNQCLMRKNIFGQKFFPRAFRWFFGVKSIGKSTGDCLCSSVSFVFQRFDSESRKTVKKSTHQMDDLMSKNTVTFLQKLFAWHVGLLLR